ncbi:hypothetical protein EV207_11112 [Scopulibacillus darangshiensis]|uniref:Uncharacterized protein n=1 Tax=Scopulibacillus darangshiensis TaxID=442528 RepID=A0A4R2P3E5_9BACL|nr:hypothetical protein [Scopulibacillus darangshiensis]TCP29213.1 hypothetical protein EV207_11112 [Scopulibacillus darangshiensis]
MIWGSILGITFVVALIILYEWPKLKQGSKKEKATVVVLTGAGWLLAVLLVFFPEMPGPTDVIKAIFQPLGRYMEK